MDIHFTSLRSIPFHDLVLSAVKAAAEYKSKLMYQTDFRVQEWWKKLFFNTAYICITSTVVTHQIPDNIIWEHVRATIIIQTFSPHWEYTKHTVNHSEYKNNVGSFLALSKLTWKYAIEQQQQ